MKLPDKGKVLRPIVVGLDILLFVVSVGPNFYSMLWESPLFREEATGADYTISLLFDGGTVVYVYAVLSAMIQKYSTKYLTQFCQFGLRRTILYLATYLAGIGVLVNGQGLTGLFPDDMPMPPEIGGTTQFVMLVSSAAALVLSVKYYKFLGRRREAGQA